MSSYLDDDDGTIMNIFWTDGQAIMDYSVFGDALSFDTTFSTNKFQMPFAPFIGVNHHKQTILFGAAVLYNESADEDSESSSEMTEYVAKTMVPFRAPERIKGPMKKRSKDVLEGAKKGKKKKGKGTNYPGKESVFVPSAVGPSEFNFAGTINPSIAMAFGEYPSFLGSPIQGEFTRLLLEAHGDGTTPPAARQLDFNNGASTSRFQP